jgi:hypothetical protein
VLLHVHRIFSSCLALARPDAAGPAKGGRRQPPPLGQLHCCGQALGATACGHVCAAAAEGPAICSRLVMPAPCSQPSQTRGY